MSRGNKAEERIQNTGDRIAPGKNREIERGCKEPLSHNKTNNGVKP